MLITRWQAQNVPTTEQVLKIFRAEGLSPVEESFPSESKCDEHRHPYDEVRMIVKGNIYFSVSGTKLLLRPGDKIEIPSNTRHEMEVEGPDTCVSVFSKRLF
jgi:quercetin dioxygenase-like cupin family protein